MPLKEQAKSSAQIRAKHHVVRPEAQSDEVRESAPASAAQKAGQAPKMLTPSDVLQLQHTIGNQPVQRQLAGPIIQRRGTYAPLNIMPAGNLNAIEEQEYGSSNTPGAIAFTSITSCLGFLVRSGNTVYGLHLGIMDGQDINVSTVAPNNLAAAINGFWPHHVDAVYLVGMRDTWQYDLTPIYQTVCRNADEMAGELNQSGNIYSARVVGGKLEVSRNQGVIWTEP